ncbi:MAG: dimethyl sulfoxide reductase anchor subunit [Alphaproteobacteria bacterium]|nr:dimethyl sulfoxide reductase anchor subunit [Alphaproteobacteria bacterium]
MGNKRYDQLITDLRGDYRPQREWGVGNGILMVIGHFLVGLAGGAWMMATIYDATAGLVVAYLLGGLGALVHLMYLGVPRRVFGMMRHFRTSWISRGFIGFGLFFSGGTVYLGIELFLAPGSLTPLAWVANAVAMVGAVIIIGYMGFCYTASKAIPFWHSPLHPALYIAFAFRGGIAVLLVVAAIAGTAAGPWLLQLWIGITAMVALFFALEIQGALAGGNVAARWSVRDILAGRLALLFYGGTLVLGLIVPLVMLSADTVDSPATMAVIGLASAAGDFFMKLATVRAGVYLPLVLPQHRRQRA